ncbi:MAG: L,D-transpeptidase family protein [Verrucomicrobiae bacterium]|nr:L,D-transpeptidase family protein [Verrucomicrobiae bacterium]NNJ44110.1 L,D-transpeptidase family protein [Akkermansiaceae bacterium]
MKALLFLCLASTWISAQVPSNCTQAIVGIARDWNTSHVTLTVHEKQGRHWKPVGTSWQGRLGRNGLAWGRGLHPLKNNPAPLKREGDRRSPAGIFKIGGAYGYAAEIKRHPRLPYRQLTPRDLWVENKSSPDYNRHLILDHDPTSDWEKKAQMRQNDHAHSLKLYIAHNDAILGGRAIPGLGSAIFFHIWRGGGKQSTAGCTTMAASQLQQLIARIDPAQKPVFILLPKTEYQQLHRIWKLP